MSALRLDQFLASAALVFILAAPVPALGQQTEPSQTSPRAPSKAGDASAGDALTSPPASATQAAAPAIAPEESRAPDRLTALDPADRAIAERIRDLLDTKPNRIFADEKAHPAVEAFYQKRNLEPLWLDKGVENARSKAVIARLKNADADGLDHADYKTPTFGGLSPDALAEAELSLTQTVLTYARHLQAGRVPHRQVREDNIALPQRAPDPAVVLAAVVEGDDAGQALDQFSPPYEHYRKLKAALSQLRGRTAGGARDGIAAGRMLTFNRKHLMEDARVPQLRERLGVPGEATDLRYDEKLAQAVKEYQRGNDLPPTGNLDARTVKKLNPTNDSRIDTIIANMER
jgi:murein L,D-transpeptidase YcbB/YkuD